MSAPRVIVYGAGLLGRQVAHCLLRHTDAKIVGFVDDSKEAGSVVCDGLLCLGGLAQAAVDADTRAAAASMVFAIGYADMQARGAALRRAQELGYELFTLIHPRAWIEPGAQVGPGSVVLAGAIVDQGVRLGPACYLDIGVRLGEGSVVGANNYFSSGTAIGGSVTIGEDNFFGMDCTATTGVAIGSNCFINAKSLVAANLGNDVKLVELHKAKQIPRAARMPSA